MTTTECSDALAMARAGLARAGDRPILHYFRTAITGTQLDETSDALAELGVAAGDRIVVQLQNMPQFPLAILAAWKLRATAVPANPMYRERDLSIILRDARTEILVTLNTLFPEVAGPAAAAGGVPYIITTSGLDLLDGELMVEHRVTFAVAAITAYTALKNTPGCVGADLSSLRVVHSGGAPVAPAMLERWESLTGTYIHNSYGMTETTAPSHLVAVGARAPIDPDSGARSVGKPPVHHTHSEIHDDAGNVLGAREIGQIVASGLQVVLGYWEKPEETAATLGDGLVRTGDVGFVDQNGWFYIVDRSKDLTVASCYKVWPREVQDILPEHPAVSEVAMVGLPDDYRGETVKAFVTLREDIEIDILRAYRKTRLAAYKIPAQIESLDDLPKTPRERSFAENFARGKGPREDAERADDRHLGRQPRHWAGHRAACGA